MGPTRIKKLKSRGAEFPDKEKMGPTRIKKLKSRGIEFSDRKKMVPTRIKKLKSRGAECPDKEKMSPTRLKNLKSSWDRVSGQVLNAKRSNQTENPKRTSHHSMSGVLFLVLNYVF